MSNSFYIADKTLNIAEETFEELLAQFLCDVKGDDEYYETLAHHIASNYLNEFKSILTALSEKRLLGAIRGIGLTGSNACDETLYQYTNHRNPFIAAAALDALNMTGGTPVNRIHPLLEHDSPIVRCAVLRFIRARNTKKTSTRNILLDALKDPDDIVRYTALSELEGLIKPGDFYLIEPFVNDSDESIQHAARCLIMPSTKQRPDNTQNKTVRLIRKRPEIQKIENLNIDHKSFEELMALFFVEVRGNSDYYDNLAWRIAEDYLPQFATMLPLLSDTRLRSAILGLGLTGASAYDETVFLYLSHDNERIVACSLDTLCRTGKVSWSRVAHLLNHESGMVRAAALKFARDRLEDEAKPLLVTALKDPDPLVRQTCLNEIEEMLKASEISQLTHLLEDPDRSVRKAAHSVIERCKNKWRDSVWPVQGAA